MRAILFLAALVLCLIIVGGESFAATAPKEPPHAPGTSVEMPYLIAPLNIDGKLVSYAYVSSRIIASTPSAAIDIREKTPFIQDAYLRDVNAQSIGDSSDPPVIDQKALISRLLADAQRVVGAGKATSVEIIQIQCSALRPSPRS